MMVWNRSLCVLLMAFFVGEMASGQNQTTNQSAPREVVFVCEHGAALSVVSAAYFNKLTQEQHLGFHAVPRGVTPQENLSPQASAGLKNDGLAPESEKPLGLSKTELGGADRVVTFFPIPEKYATKAPVENWNDVTWGPGSYEKSRDAILRHLQELLTRLKAETRTP
jgi:arsenate reductase (thioredoxin)